MRAVEGAKVVFRIVSNDPDIKDILEGRNPSSTVPRWGSGSDLGGWAGRHGFTSNKAKHNLARKIARHGSSPAGTYEGRQDWIRESLIEATR